MGRLTKTPRILHSRPRHALQFQIRRITGRLPLWASRVRDCDFWGNIYDGAAFTAELYCGSGTRGTVGLGTGW